MKLTYFGHAAVGMETDGGVRVLIDPYLPGAFGNKLRYSDIPGKWDIVVITHEHLDHNHVAPGFGKPVVLRAPGSVSGIDVRMYRARHGDNLGTMEALTNVAALLLDDLRVVHPGDLGENVPAELIANLTGADLMFVPVGGRFTLGPKGAADFISAVRPRLVIPVHYKTAACDLPIEPVDAFLRVCPFPVKRLNDSTAIIDSGTLPARTDVWVLHPLCLAQVP